MKLIKLELKNFLGWKKASLDLSKCDGIVSILGAYNGDVSKSNGVGKSSIITAISFSLFGKTAVSNISSLIHTGADSFKVSLEFEYKNERYLITRSKKQNGSQIKKFIKINTKEIIKQEPYEYMNISPEIWHNTIYSAQGNMAGFTKLTPAGRKDILSKIFSLDSYLKLERTTRDIANNLIRKKDTVKGKLEQISAHISNLELRIASIDYKNIEENICFLKEKLINQESKQKELNDKLIKYEKDFSQYVSLKNKIEELHIKKEHIQEQLSNVEESYAENISQYEIKLKEFSDLDKNDIENKLQILKNELAKLNILENSNHDLLKQISKYGEEIAILNNRLIDIKNKSTELSNTLEKYKQLGNVCPTCGSEISIDKINEYTALIYSDIEKLYTERNAILEKLKEFENKKIELNNIYTANINKLSEKYTIENELRKMEKNLQDIAMADNYRDLLSKLRLKLQQEKTFLETELKSVDASIQSFINELQNYSDLTSNRNKISVELDNVRETIKEINEDIISQQKELAEYNILRNEIDLEKKSYAELEKEIIEIELELKTYTTLSDAFGPNGIPVLILENNLAELQYYMDEYISKLSFGKISVKFKTIKEGKTGDKDTLEIEVSDDKGSRPLESYSGGEKVRIYLALRLALMKMLTKKQNLDFNILIIDEIAELDDSGLQMFNAVLNMIAKDFSQIFIVSHLSELKSSIGSNLVLYKNIYNELEEILYDNKRL